MSRLVVTVWVVSGLVAAGGGRAAASCRVTNETAFTFTVASGNVSNQRVRGHSTTTIEAGKIQGRSDEGKTISGQCKDGGDLVIQQKNGVPLLMPSRSAPKARIATAIEKSSRTPALRAGAARKK